MLLKCAAILYDNIVGQTLANEAAKSNITTNAINISDGNIQKIIEQYHDPAKKGYRHGLHKTGKKSSSYSHGFQKADIVIDCTKETLEFKKKLFKYLDYLCPADTVFVTNSFTCNLTLIAAETKRPAKVAGLNLDAQGDVIEIIKTVATSDETMLKVKGLLNDIYDQKIIEFSDFSTPILHQVIMPMINEAAYFLMLGMANEKEIDSLMTLGPNMPVGPLALADLIGLDECLNLLEKLYKSTGDGKFYPCRLFYKYIQLNRLGCKTGRGFYEYTDSLY
ncbi:3-hydroxybutyryl-CoA dehydrogenase [Desulfotomaculum arcticum]|uniref:3-hydroxybutyryl-CoA dehydrogenase n=1 Tax=Desulfotruncus arcticus DSM 17038 TaxID=1121424 RepID=A0A1I2XQ64_9FIRM|nr:3-hydroxyacyl-CoA dehydrogenase family protein [Desulfotruncus arcticus]SFH14211.1 3-hydroxybutyryl-CoA dehydrogenase [Desulfotomaculum arcticum] [Desulfotruncus arcticus DSM 17038]